MNYPNTRVQVSPPQKKRTRYTRWTLGKKTLSQAKATQAKKSSQSTQLSWPRLLGTVWALPPPFWTPPIKTSTDLICFTQTKILHASMGKTIGIKRCIEQKLPRQKKSSQSTQLSWPRLLGNCVSASSTVLDASNKNQHGSDLLHTDQNSSCLDGQNYRNKTLYRAKATQAKKSSQSTQLSWPRLLGTVWALPPPFWTPPIKTSTDLICFTQTKILHASMGKTIGIKRCIEQKLPRQKKSSQSTQLSWPQSLC